MIQRNKKISLRQLQILLIFDIFGTEVLILPRIAAELGKRDGWMLVFGGMAISLFMSIWITYLCSLFPKDTFVEFTSKIVSKPIGILLSIGLFLKFIIGAGLELNVLGNIIHETMLPKTPFFLIVLLMLTAASYVAYHGYECRARIGEILIVFAFVPLIFVYLCACFDADFSNLKPFFTLDSKAFVNGSFHISRWFYGIEFLLMAYPFFNQHQNAAKKIRQSICISGVLLTGIVAITIARFSDYDVVRKIWPALQMMDTIYIPGSFLERQDILMMIFFIITAFAIVNGGIFFSSLLLSRIYGKNSQSKFVWIVMPLVFLAAIFPENIAKTYYYMDIINKSAGYFYLIGLPIGLIILVKIKSLMKSLKKGGEVHE